MLSESLTKTKFTDPLILDLLQNIREHRSMLEDLKSIKIDPKLTNIKSEVISSLNFELDLLFPEQEITPRDIGVNNKK